MFELRKIAREFEKTKQGEIAGDEASRLKEIIEFQGLNEWHEKVDDAYRSLTLGKYMEQLESELAGFRGVFNSRIQWVALVFLISYSSDRNTQVLQTTARTLR
jgi:hypothetical protein